MTELVAAISGVQGLPFAITLDFLTATTFWTGVGILAGTYALLALGLQLNVGFTGVVNFGQAGFMAVGAYAMAILVVKADWSVWLAMPAAIAITMLFGLLVGLPSLRLRADYFAIATIAAAELVRLIAQNARGLTGGNQGLFCEGPRCYDDTWNSFSSTVEGWLKSLGWAHPESLFPLLIVVWIVVAIVTVGLHFVTRTPWGRVLRAVREDEDAARALGKNTLVYKLQSLAISSAIAAVAGFFLALDLATIHPTDFEPLVTFIGFAVLVLGGLANYWGIAIGSIVMWVLLEGTRFIELPISDEHEAALRFMIVGVVLILLMAFRPQGLFGNKQEMVLGE
jgi:branched-chain amino acid transport system permease protein